MSSLSDVKKVVEEHAGRRVTVANISGLAKASAVMTEVLGSDEIVGLFIERDGDNLFLINSKTTFYHGLNDACHDACINSFNAGWVSEKVRREGGFFNNTISNVKSLLLDRIDTEHSYIGVESNNPNLIKNRCTGFVWHHDMLDKFINIVQLAPLDQYRPWYKVYSKMIHAKPISAIDWVNYKEGEFFCTRQVSDTIIRLNPDTMMVEHPALTGPFTSTIKHAMNSLEHYHFLCRNKFQDIVKSLPKNRHERVHSESAELF